MDIFASLQAFDRMVFEWINSGLGNPVFDVLLPLFREKLFWAPLYLFIAVFIRINFGRRGFRILLLLVATVGVTDYTSSTLIKKTVQRVRPCNDAAMEAIVIERVSCGSGYSFTSSHAANHFAVACFLIGAFGYLSRWVRPVLLAWASAIALAQVYVGVHYPLDVLAGGMLGAAISWIALWAARRFGILPVEPA